MIIKKYINGRPLPTDPSRINKTVSTPAPAALPIPHTIAPRRTPIVPSPLPTEPPTPQKKRCGGCGKK